MKKQRTQIKRALALFLALCIVVMSVPFVASADRVPLHYQAITDPATVNGWKGVISSGSTILCTSLR